MTRWWVTRCYFTGCPDRIEVADVQQWARDFAASKGVAPDALQFDEMTDQVDIRFHRNGRLAIFATLMAG